jgi:hypothetical protein
MTVQDNQWDIRHLREHLQFAAELEAWTIPYYISAMFSIRCRSTLAYQLIQSVVHQEMLHLQLVANVANAYGYRPRLDVGMFKYDSPELIPHLNFRLDPVDPTPDFTPYSAELGPLDDLRINAMCLIEYPSWQTGATPGYRDDMTDYGSIGEFYDALEYGARQLKSHIVGGVGQVDMFSAFYRELPQVKVESSGAEGFAQVQLLIDVIRDQGEAAKADDAIHPPHRNTADDPRPACSHYDKFRRIRCSLPRSETYPVKPYAEYTDADHQRLHILVNNFKKFTRALNELLAGKNPDNFGPLMATIGGNILACWKNGVTPKFYRPESTPQPAQRALTGDRGRRVVHVR